MDCPDCTLGFMMVSFRRAQQAAAWLAIASFLPSSLIAQQASTQPAHAEATEIALPLPEDRGAAALEQSLKRLGTWASLMDIVAHPDDEDGGMLTYESRGQGVRTSLLTLTRGEGGQNAMNADTYDALGILRTNELLKADEFYGIKEYWGTEADFGFSKTQEESFARWGHERVLCDTILAVREERPLVLVATFVGGITDGHGQHQVSGEIAQEAYLQAGDPKVCPEQIAAGLRPWTPLKVYARVPFAPVTEKGMFDYATGKWAPARFYNYVTKEWSTTAPKGDVDIPASQYDPVLGRTYSQIAGEGWGMQKSQNGGANPRLSGGDGDEYHRYGSRVKDQKASDSSFFDGIRSDVVGLASLITSPFPKNVGESLVDIDNNVQKAQKAYSPEHPADIAPILKAGYRETEALRANVLASSLTDIEKTNLTFELDLKLQQFQTALAQALGLDLQAFTVTGKSTNNGPFGGGTDESPRSVTPGSPVQVHIHTGNATGEAKLARVWLEGHAGDWKTAAVENPGADPIVKATVPADAAPTQPYFARPNTEQPYYNVSNPADAGRSFAPYPLAAWAEFDYQGVPIRLGEVVQTMQRVTGPGGILEPLVITPPIGLRLEPAARILPLDGSPLPVRVSVHSEAAAKGTLRLKLPEGWNATPAEIAFDRAGPGDSEPMLFEVKPPATALHSTSAFTIRAVAESGGKTYESGWRTVGYLGLRPYNLYRKAELMTRAIDVKVAPNLRIAYVMGTGDDVPEAIGELTGTAPHLLTAGELASADLSAWDEIVIGIRAYSNRPELAAAQPRLNAFVQAGGTLIVQYQSANFPAPVPLSMGRTPERVVDESDAVKLLAPENSLLTFPNQITSHDFDGWVEERGHSFLDSWDPAYTALTETADQGQDPQRGGLIVSHPGKGTYIYVAYALYRQLPELVPGSYRILANLLSAPKTAK
jgi:LmbE family N-acetylglucosaminyl deacetylase